MSKSWDKKLVEIYVEMTRDYQGPLLIDWMLKYVEPGSSVLELGMGPGKDLAELQKYYRATGSDSAPDFLHRFRAFHPHADLFYMDAVAMETDEKFDCICSNKVLMHLTREELQDSLQEQNRVLTPDGTLLHTFWTGSGEEEYEGILTVSYSNEELKAIFQSEFEIVNIEKYQEEAEGDSILVVAKKRG